jgi:hypothetical protein
MAAIVYVRFRSLRQSSAKASQPNAPSELPFNDILLVELKKIASIPEILEWISELVAPLKAFKKDALENANMYEGVRDMLASPCSLTKADEEKEDDDDDGRNDNYYNEDVRGIGFRSRKKTVRWGLQPSQYWRDDYEEQKKVVPDEGYGFVALRVTKNEILARRKFATISIELLKKPLPGADSSNTRSNREFHKRIVHNLLLTVVMDFQWRHEDFFQSLLLGPKIAKWPRVLLLHRTIFKEYGGEDDDMPTTKPQSDPPVQKTRKKKCGPRGGLRKRLTNYCPTKEQGVKRKRSTLPTNGQGWEVDSAH